jgi:hypothetical protein
MLETLRNKNPNTAIYELTDSAFGQFGRLLTDEDYDFSAIIRSVEAYGQIPDEGDIYIKDLEELATPEERQALSNALFGEMPIQIGYGAGRAKGFTFGEYHQGNEILIWLDPAINILGDFRDIVNGELDAKKLKAFFVPAGSAIELYSGTFHGLPYTLGEFYRLCCVLPYSTNFPREHDIPKTGEAKLLVNKNSWQVHPMDSPDAGVFKGIKGKLNIEV